jgi:hypothetical protein
MLRHHMLTHTKDHSLAGLSPILQLLGSCLNHLLHPATKQVFQGPQCATPQLMSTSVLQQMLRADMLQLLG